jgi:23S rRNA pseudouridine1911/1915/1917 synthase
MSAPDMPNALEKLSFRVEPAEVGERIDAFLARREPRFSRSRFKALIEGGRVSIGERAVCEPSRRLAAGDFVAVALPAPEAAEPQPEAMALDIVYEDDDLIVIDKPPGLVVHPGAGNPSGTLVNALIAHCGDSLSGIGGVRRPGIVHRLDKDTSGLLVVAKNDAAHRALAAQFADHGREGPLLREYDALVWGAPNPHIGAIEAPLERDRTSRTKQAVSRSGGRRALTRYAVKEAFAGFASLLTCRLDTGRTHQIRVHMAHIGHPLVGDATYGAGFATKAERLPAELRDRVKAFARQALHARLLRFAHPRSGETLRFETNWPADMAGLVRAFRKLAVQ